MMPVWLDLCSGLGGASQPALDRGWKVIRLDLDRSFRPDIVADVRQLPLKPFHVDVLWASPPCTDFTKAGWRMAPSPERAALRALIPYEIGESIARAIESRHDRGADNPARGQ